MAIPLPPKVPRIAVPDLFPEYGPPATNKALRAAFGAVARLGIASVTANYAMQPGDEYVRADATAGALTVALPPSAAVGGLELVIKKVDGTANAVTIACSGSDTIDGQASITFANRGQVVRLVSTGTGYDITSAESYGLAIAT